MASETATNINGAYDSQYNQPAELAASTPSHGTQSQNQSSSSTQQKADPQEIGWYFVEQYYTTLSKTPERIHLFYSKKSQLVTGTEAEKVVPSVGSRAISEKIKSLDIQDCKVRVLNVDSQSSFDNIVVQVIGELSNKSQPHRKFVQTFVLATQPNGYFVLNDIFRYLSDEEDEIIEDRPADETTQPMEVATEVEAPVEDKAVTGDIVDTEAAVHAVDDKLQESIEQSNVAEPEGANGVEFDADADADTDADAEAAAEVEVESKAEVDTEVIEATASTADEPVITESVAIPSVEQPSEPEPTPTTEAPTKPVADAAPAKKTWASLVGNKAPAIPALPTTTPSATQPKPARPTQSTTLPKSSTEVDPVATTAPTATATSPAAPAATSSSPNNGWQTADHGKKTKGPQQKASDGIVHAYIKNVTDKVDARILREVLEKFGELKYFDVSRPRNCAFVEFADPAGYAAAVAASPHDVGGEPITVEERRPRPGQFGNTSGNFSRGGANATRGRGGLQGRTGSQGSFPKEGRGGFTQRGGKSGNVTPKGRGQTQAA